MRRLEPMIASILDPKSGGTRCQATPASGRAEAASGHDDDDEVVVAVVATVLLL